MNKRVSFLSMSQFPRRKQLAYATVPFAQGEWDGSTPLCVAGRRSQVIPWGRPYPDGSRRYGQLVTEVSTVEHGEETVTVTEGAPDTPTSFMFGPGLSAADWKFAVFAKVAGAWTEAAFGNWEVAENTPLRQVLRSTIRIGDTSFVGILTLILYHDQDTSDYELVVIGSDPRVTHVEYPIEELDLVVDGAYVTVFNAQKRGVHTIEPFRRYRLLPETHFGDGQGQLWFGSLLTPVPTDEDSWLMAAAQREWPMIGMAHDWVACQEAFGAHGRIGTPIDPVSDGGIRQTHERFQELLDHWQQPGDPWSESKLGVTKTPGQVGGQDDFGVLNGWELLYFPRRSGALIPLYFDAASEEWKRPGHYREADGSMVLGVDHPDWVTWSGITHFHPSVGRDKLGKSSWYDPGDTHVWAGKDYQHHTSNLLYLAMVMTGSHSLMDRARYEVEYLLHGRTLASTGHAGWSTTYEGWHRGWGRPVQAMLNLDTVLADDRIIPHEIERIMDPHDGLLADVAKDNPNWSGYEQPTVTQVMTDARLGIKIGSRGWTAWNAGLCCNGAIAFLRAHELPELRAMLNRVASSIIRHATKITRDALGQIIDVQVAHGMIVLPDDSSPLNADGSIRGDLDPNDVFHPAGFGLGFWSLPMWEWAASECDDPLARERAREVLAWLPEARRRQAGPRTELPLRDYLLRWSTR